MWLHSKGNIFSTYKCVFFPTVVRILVERLHLCFLTHTKKYMTSIQAILFKNMSKCVFILEILKGRCNFTTLCNWEYMQQKKVGWEVIFSELGFAGSRARKPRRVFEGCSAFEPFFHVVLRLNGVLNVQLNYIYQIKTSVKLMTFDRKNQIIPWQGVYFFDQHCFTKIIEAYCCD